MDIDIVEINNKMLSAGKTLLERKGIKDGGLYNYYNERIKHGKMLSDYEVFVVEYVSENYPKTCSIIEPAAGIGTLSHALYLAGFENITSCDYDIRRYSANHTLREYLGTKVKVIDNTFPSPSLKDFDLAILTNAQSSHNSFSELVEFIITSRADVIMMPRLWEVEVDYELGCSLLSGAEIPFTEIGYELIHIKK